MSEIKTEDLKFFEVEIRAKIIYQSWSWVELFDFEILRKGE